jgi:hypothetical protein
LKILWKKKRDFLSKWAKFTASAQYAVKPACSHFPPSTRCYHVGPGCWYGPPISFALSAWAPPVRYFSPKSPTALTPLQHRESRCRAVTSHRYAQLCWRARYQCQHRCVPMKPWTGHSPPSRVQCSLLPVLASRLSKPSSRSFHHVAAPRVQLNSDKMPDNSSMTRPPCVEPL